MNRLDRITCLALTNEHFDAREIKSISEFFRRNLSEYQLEQITLRFPKTQSALIQTTRYYYGYIGEEVKGDQVDMNFIVNDLNYFCRWLLMYADVVEIVHNHKLRQLYLELISDIKKRFT